MTAQLPSNERAPISAGASELMMELFNRMPVEALKSVPEPIAKRIGDFMVANGYRIVFDRWYLQAEPHAPETGERRFTGPGYVLDNIRTLATADSLIDKPTATERIKLIADLCATILSPSEKADERRVSKFAGPPCTPPDPDTTAA